MENDIKNLCIKDPNILLNVLGIDGVPGVIKIARSFGFEVFSVNNQSSIDTKLERQLSNIKGIVCVKRELSSSSIKRILFNDSLAPTTRRFIVAYLLSDYVLNGNLDDEYIEIIYDESIYDRKVYNYTLDLLMPDGIFTNALEQIKEREKLAKKFDVSEVLVDEKIKRLKKRNSNLKLL